MKGQSGVSNDSKTWIDWRFATESFAPPNGVATIVKCTQNEFEA
jgi:hypothetical protein